MVKSKTTKSKKTESDSFEINVTGKNLEHIGKNFEHVCRDKSRGSSYGGIYGVGLIGALIYFIATSTSFWDGVIGILKALVWPAFVVYGLLGFLGL